MKEDFLYILRLPFPRVADRLCPRLPALGVGVCETYSLPQLRKKSQFTYGSTLTSSVTSSNPTDAMFNFEQERLPHVPSKLGEPLKCPGFPRSKHNLHLQVIPPFEQVDRTVKEERQRITQLDQGGSRWYVSASPTSFLLRPTLCYILMKSDFPFFPCAPIKPIDFHSGQIRNTFLLWHLNPSYERGASLMIKGFPTFRTSVERKKDAHFSRILRRGGVPIPMLKGKRIISIPYWLSQCLNQQGRELDTKRTIEPSYQGRELPLAAMGS